MYEVKLEPYPTWEFRQAKTATLKEPTAKHGTDIGLMVLSGGTWKFEPKKDLLLNVNSLKLITESLETLNENERTHAS